jgi:hypothetical protein
MAIEVSGIPLQQVLIFPLQNAASRKRFFAALGFSLLGLLIPFIPGIPLMGYTLQILRKAAREGSLEMPAWDDWNRLFLDGLLGMAISLIYLGPGILCLMAGFGFYLFGFPILLSLANSIGSQVMIYFFLAIALMMGFMILGFLLLLAGAIPSPIALARFAETGEFRSAFELRKIWESIRANPMGYVAIWVVAMGLYQCIYILFNFFYLTVLCCCIGWLLTIVGGVWIGLVWNGMIGLVYRESKMPAVG